MTDNHDHDDEVSDFIARNRDALNASIRKGRRELAEGKISTRSIDDIIADGRRRHSKPR